MQLKNPSPWRINVGFGSDTGRHRKRNEDAYHVSISPPETEEGVWPDGVLAVADGMGGHDAGDVASRFIVDSLSEAFAAGGEIGEPTGEAISARLERFFHRINGEMRALSEGRGAVRGMGSTLTLTVIHEGSLFLAHVGDSRLYRLRDAKLTQVTEDHSWAAEQRRKGLITAEEEANHPQKNLLTECIGVDRRINVQLLETPLVAGDRFLLCSDGMHGPVDNVVIEELLTNERSPQTAVDRLIDLANEAGGPDNITGVVFDVFLDPSIATISSASPSEDSLESTREIASPKAGRRTIEWVNQESDDPGMTRVIRTKTETGISRLAQLIIFGGVLLILGGAGAWYLSGREGGIRGALRSYVGLDPAGPGAGTDSLPTARIEMIRIDGSTEPDTDLDAGVVADTSAPAARSIPQEDPE